MTEGDSPITGNEMINIYDHGGSEPVESDAFPSRRREVEQAQMMFHQQVSDFILVDRHVCPISLSHDF